MNQTRGDQRTDPGSDPGMDSGGAARLSRPAAPGGSMTWPPALPFEQALQRAQAADRYAMGLLYKRFLPVIYRYALARVGDIHAAEDITADTFFVIVERIAETRAHDELTFVAWALGIARNQAAMYFRRRKTRPTARPMTADEADVAHWLLPGERDPLDVITARESLSEVVAALERLTEEQRTVILYRAVLGYSAEDVGKLLGKQPGAVRALQFRALSALERLLRSAEGARADARAMAGSLMRRSRHQSGED